MADKVQTLTTLQTTLFDIPGVILGKILYMTLGNGKSDRASREQKLSIKRGKGFPVGDKPWQFIASVSIRSFACTCKLARQIATKYRTKFYGPSYMRFERKALVEYHKRKIQWHQYGYALVNLFTRTFEHSLYWKPLSSNHSFKDLLTLRYSNAKLHDATWREINRILRSRGYYTTWTQVDDRIVWTR